MRDIEYTEFQRLGRNTVKLISSPHPPDQYEFNTERHTDGPAT
jgi:hypothetical protein